ncbi:hypothetical protein JAAARDRAFT_42648 [Jaapia argillacea MUCL 33604]|uniref:DUF6533 domain-containing protein n=1 Tax=Jaapia argillacea MUCL 33604 TaxID=933084 RepID=A0A067P7B0_9AGAM|nr:hypothetical protein JAAARDRAFT_42648 [Jaapia argillacea MUCL 33604]
MAVDVSAFEEASWVRCSRVAVAFLMVYEYVLQLDSEIEHFWNKNWSVGKCIYLCPARLTLVRLVFLLEDVSFSVSNKFFDYQDTCTCLIVLATHVVLEMRLYAMYGNSKIILAISIFLNIGELAFMAALGAATGGGSSTPLGTNEPFPGLIICTDGDLPHKHWYAFFWTAVIAVESILLALALFKAWTDYRKGLGSSLITILARDSAIYFVVIFWLYMFNQIIWIFNRMTLNELSTGFSTAISTIAVNRMVISVRDRYYNDTSEHTLTSHQLEFLHPSEEEGCRTEGSGTTLDHGAVELGVVEVARSS